jgi:hypothetical protein
VVLLAAALALPRVQRALDPQRERRVEHERGPVFVMPNGERRRAVAVTHADPALIRDARGDRALWWWCGILAAVIIAGAVAQSVGARLTDDDEDSS